MASSRKPTLVLVQGAFQLPEVYYKLSDALRATGYRVVQPPLPSLTDQDKPEFPTKSLTDDALVIRSKVTELVEEGDTVFMVLHSYGGLVGTEAVTKDLSFEERKSKGLAGGVLHLFYIAAFILTEGQSVLSSYGEFPNILVKPNGRFTLKNTADILYNDLPAAEAQYWESKTIDQSYAVLTTIATNEGFRFVPSTYVVCENDHGSPPELEESFGKTTGSEIIKLNSGHSPMLSHTEELAEMINQAVQSAVEGKGIQ